MVSKRRGSMYRSGESEAWLKIKCWELGNFDLLGIKRENGKRTEAIVARDGKYAGSPSIALTKEIRERLLRRVRKAKPQPPAGLPKAVATADVEWVQPGFKAVVRSLRGEPKLRHGSVKEIRED